MSSPLPLNYGFNALVGPNPHTLILGSMPSDTSLDQQRYYAHPRNSFWPIISTIYQLPTSLDYQQRCQQLVSHGIAVWDVLKACQRAGSLDQAIELNSMLTNDFKAFFQHQPQIDHLVFNGTKAQQIYCRHCLPTLDIHQQDFRQTRLPSTSPAHAAMSFEQKQLLWQQALRPNSL